MKLFTYSLNGELQGYGKRFFKHIFCYKSLEDGTLSYIKLFNFIKFSWQKIENYIEYQFRIYLGKIYVFEINGDGIFNPRNFFCFEAKVKRTRAKISFILLGLYNSIRIGHIVTDHYDSHSDRYYYWEYDENKDISYEYTDETKQQKYIFVEPYQRVYKDFYISKFIKIYTKDWLNCLYGRAIELALPFFHYLKIDFKKPFYNREWLGFRSVINFEHGLLFKVTLMFFKHELRIIIAKNKLYRQSNLFSIKAIKRVFQLSENINYTPKECMDYISVLLNHRKSAQFLYLFKNIPFADSDLKKHLIQLNFEHICPAHNFCRPIFEFICNKIIELDIPIDTWEHLTEDNNYIDEYAKKKLLQLRTEYIKQKIDKSQTNKIIIEIINRYIQDNPDMRFIQVLWALGIINIKDDWLIEDRFNEESKDTLNKLKQMNMK